MMPVRITPRAACDLSNAKAWLFERNPRAAKAWIKGIRAMISELGRFPDAHPLAQEAHTFGFLVRCALYGQGTRWRVYYALIDEIVYVLHVRHGLLAPDWSKLD